MTLRQLFSGFLATIGLAQAGIDSFDINMISGRSSSLSMRSVKLSDKADLEPLFTLLKEDPRNPSVGIGMVDTHVKRRVEEGNPYHMVVFSSAPEEKPIAAVIQGRMPVFGFATGKSYDPIEHAAIIQKWKDLGVRHTVEDHDERVENLGLLNWVPLIRPDVNDDQRKDIYSTMLNLAHSLRSKGALMPAENNHNLECTDKALPKDVLLLFHPEYRDVKLLQELGFTLDDNPEFEKFYNVPRVMLTYDITPTEPVTSDKA